MAPLTAEQLRFVLQGVHYDWWQKEMQPRLDRAFGGKVPDSIQKGLFDASVAGFQAGYAMGYEAARRDAGLPPTEEGGADQSGAG